jgi:hypothetical protein
LAIAPDGSVKSQRVVYEVAVLAST